MIHFYLRPISKTSDSLNIFVKVIEYLMTFVGDIEIKNESPSSAVIFYLGTPTVARLTLEKTGQITVSVSVDDNVTINLINNQAQNLGFRIYNSQINAYLPNDVNLYDLSTIKVDPIIKKVLSMYHLNPLFQYRDSLIFFCLNEKSEVVLVNRHYLEYLLSSKDSEMSEYELFTKIADNISKFIALFDRGLISLINPNSKVINLSGFDIFNLPKNTKLNIINFTFDEENQNFAQQDTIDKLPKKYLALKIGQDYLYKKVEGKLIKFLNVSVYN